MRKKNVALYQQILTKSELRGPTYFFPLFNKAYADSRSSKFNLIYIVKTDNPSLLKKSTRNAELDTANIVFLPERNHRFKKTHETLDLWWCLLKHRIKLLHICTFSSSDPFHQLQFISKLPPFLRPKITLNITYNGHAPAFLNQYQGRFSKYKSRHLEYLKIKWAGVLSWYEDIFAFAKESHYFGQNPIVATVQNRFCDMDLFHPEHKEKIIFWAGALEAYKHPEYFLEAVNQLHKEIPEVIQQWKFILLGTGPLENQVREYIQKHELRAQIELLPSQPDYYKIVNKSMAHIATQELDHFPSLVINEAMAGGCAILATNVGRVGLYVNDGENGYLSPSEDAEGIKAILHRFLSLPDSERNQMLHASRNLCETHHSADQFIHQIDLFWSKVLE